MIPRRAGSPDPSASLAAHTPPTRRWPRMWPWVLTLLWSASALAADKTDIITLDNGDKLTGEIKKLERGLLTVKTDAMGTLSIEWPHVASIQTKQYLEVEQTDGNRSYGQATQPNPSGSIALGTDGDKGGQAPLALDSIVRITPISQGHWIDRVNAHVSVGLSAASANDDRQVVLSGDMTYTSERNSWTLTYEGARKESANNPISVRQDVSGMYRWLWRDRWYWAATAGFTSNDELDLELRSLAGAGLGHYWMQSSNAAFSTLGGLVVTNEKFKGEPKQDSLEAMLRGQYEFFNFEDPDIDVSASLTVFPSLTVGGRIRSELSLKTRYELIKDLYLELSYIRSQDNKPPSESASKNDWSLNSSLGYKF